MALIVGLFIKLLAEIDFFLHLSLFVKDIVFGYWLQLKSSASVDKV